MKFSVTIYSLRDYLLSGRLTVPRFIEVAYRLGADAVDLGYYWRSREERVEAKRKLRELGVELAIYITSNDFVKPSLEERRGEIDRVKAAVADAKSFDATRLRVFAGDLKHGIDAAEAEKWVIEALREVSDYAASEGVVLAVENHGRYFSRIDVVERILKEVGSGNLRVTFDTGNFVFAGDSPVEAVKRLGAWVEHVHAKDVDVWGRPCAPGEGCIDFEAIVRRLKSAGYRNYLSVEYEGRRDPILAVGLGLGYLRGLLAVVNL
ncbi:MAG: sugar phosphate isomerase/epimerase family protein [Thermofilaceae archaeon]